MVRRVKSIVARLAETCSSAITLRATAENASAALIEEFPGASAVFFERDRGQETVRAVAGANIPPAWKMRAVQLKEIPLLAEAMQRPDQLARSAVVRGARDDVPAAPDSGRSWEAICGAVPDGTAEPVYVIMLIAAIEPGDRSTCELAVETVRYLLGASAALAAGNAERARTLSAIHHAKVEWENAADALPEIVGLLDRRRRIVRVSRALERWSLGAVQGAIGRDLHAVLHATCSGESCPLEDAIGRAWQEVGTSASVSFELSDPKLGRDLLVDLRVAADPSDTELNTPWHRVAFIVSNVTTLRQAERELTGLNQTLELRVADRTAEITATNHALRGEITRRREAELSLRASKEELQALSERLMNAQEEERKRIAQDLHDSVGQSLSAVKYSLERAQVLGRRQELKAAFEVVDSAVQRVRRLMSEVRSISMNLRPAQLDDLGAASAVRWLCREWHDVYSDIAIDTDIAVEDAEIPAPLATNVFRAVQESLNNVARHAGARRVQVAIRLEEGTLSVLVQDDGSGFAISGDVRRLIDGKGLQGLRGLRERAERTGGRCEIASAPGRGTTVRLAWPVGPGLAALEGNACIN